MVRTILYLLISVFLIAFLRGVIGLITKAVGSAFEAEKTPDRPAKEFGGELKKDPVCGTFVAATTSIKKTVRGEVYHFCSDSCRDRFPVPETPGAHRQA